MSRIPIAIAGYGKIARDQHEPAIGASDRFELIAVADPSTQHRTLPSYSSVASMLAAHPEIAAVSLCMPPRFRFGATADAIAHGRHVLLEKPPCTTVAEAEQVVGLAQERGVALYGAWHSQHASAVDAARFWLAGRTVHSVAVVWKEDIRVWHPGQSWIAQPGGFGVFDPGINALSILTAILSDLDVASAELEVPANWATPIAARLQLTGRGFGVSAEFDFRQEGTQTWDIAVETASGRLLLSEGGNALTIDGHAQDLAAEAEYPAIYSRFAELIDARAVEADLAPLRLVEDALRTGRTLSVEAFEEW